MEREIDSLISRVLNCCNQKLTANVIADEVLRLLHLARDTFASQPTLIEINPPVIVCGDVHGQFSDLLRIFAHHGFPPAANYLFLGDYVDRGPQSMETILLLLCYKIRYPDQFFLLRGNHETETINRVYGFYTEVTDVMYAKFQDVFNWMPTCALIGGRILGMHGGLSPHLQLRNLTRPLMPEQNTMPFDLLWSDPSLFTQGWMANNRGASYTFGADVVAAYCNAFDIDMIVRAHQVVQDGYEFFANRRLVTIFSAPHYAGQFDNAAATMSVDENLMINFWVFRPTDKPKDDDNQLKTARFNPT